MIRENTPTMMTKRLILRKFTQDDVQNLFEYAICLREENRPIGYVWLSDDESYDFGYGLKKEFWNRGLVTEAGKAVMERIEKAGYPYITATHDHNNPRSGQVMKKLGMEYQYSYVEQWKPKNMAVTFLLYRLDFSGKPPLN